MIKRLPFLFCRYDFSIEQEILDATSQFNSLSELQGTYYAHGPKAEREGIFDSAVMRPRKFEINGHTIISWSIGQRINVRISVEYDEIGDQLNLTHEPDSGVRYTDFVAVPGLRDVAVDDRVSDIHFGGRAAMRRFQSVYRQSNDAAEAYFEQKTSKQDVNRALDDWELTEFSFVIRPYNPHPVGDLSKKLSEQLAKDGIGRYTAKAKPAGGREMKPSQEGHLAAAREMADAGYGQFSVSGVTDDGHEAMIKKPRFHDEVRQNQKRQTEPRELRVYIRSEDETDEQVFKLAGIALINFLCSRCADICSNS